VNGVSVAEREQSGMSVKGFCKEGASRSHSVILHTFSTDTAIPVGLIQGREGQGTPMYKRRNNNRLHSAAWAAIGGGRKVDHPTAVPKHHSLIRGATL
jgi:hypothetical protein